MPTPAGQEGLTPIDDPVDTLQPQQDLGDHAGLDDTDSDSLLSEWTPGPALSVWADLGQDAQDDAGSIPPSQALSLGLSSFADGNTEMATDTAGNADGGDGDADHEDNDDGNGHRDKHDSSMDSTSNQFSANTTTDVVDILRARDQASVQSFLQRDVKQLREDQRLVAEHAPFQPTTTGLDEVRKFYHCLLEQYYPSSDLQTTDCEQKGWFSSRDFVKKEEDKDALIHRRLIYEARASGIVAGKWISVCRSKDVRRVWAGVVGEVMRGRLGHRAELYGQDRTGHHRIYLWTPDFDDRDQVVEIFDHLYELCHRIPAVVRRAKFKPLVFTLLDTENNGIPGYTEVRLLPYQVRQVDKARRRTLAAENASQAAQAAGIAVGPTTNDRS